MSDELIQQIAKVAGLKGNADLEDPKKGNALLNEALEEFYPQDSVRLKHLRKALNSTAKIGWDVLIQAKPAQMVDICADFVEGGNDEPAPKKKSPKGKATTKKTRSPKEKSKAKAPKATPEKSEEPEGGDDEEKETPPTKAPKKRRPVRRGKSKEELPAEEPAEEEAPKAPAKKKAAKAKEVIADAAAIEKYIEEKFDGLDKALLDVVSAADLQSFREEMMSEHARTRAMLQEFYAAVYKMIADEDYVPPAELDEG